jgi:hypothetical protein
MFLAQVPQLSTGNPKMDAIAQAAALGISLAGILVATFGKKKAPKAAAPKVSKPKATAPKVVISDEAVDEAGARR